MMSHIGKKPIILPPGVTVEVADRSVQVIGPLGTLTYSLLAEVNLQLEGSTLTVSRTGDDREARARHGLTRALLQNMVQGVSRGFSKQLEIMGVGYKAQLKERSLVLHLGYSHSITYAIPERIAVSQDEKNKGLLTISGIDRALVGQVAADLRGLRPPEPYKGKGIQYVGEKIRRKVGKTAVKTTA